MKNSLKLVAAGLFVVTASMSQAATVIVNQTVDIEALDLNSFGLASYTALDSAVTIAAGDSVDMTVNFDNGKAIRNEHLGGGSGGNFTYWLRTASPSTSWSIANVTIEFFDLNTDGDFVNGANLGTESNGSDHIGWLASGAENGLTAGEFMEFSGFNITYDVVSMTNGPSTYQNIQLSSWFGNGASVVDATPSAVPLPASLPLFMLGLAGLGVLRRRQATR